MQNAITEDLLITHANYLICRDIGQEIAIFNPNTKIPYVLRNIGVDIWNLIQKPKSIGNILGILLEEYEIEPSRCEQELLNFLQELKTEGLIDIYDSS
jgi:hypothetical protein